MRKVELTAFSLSVEKKFGLYDRSYKIEGSDCWFWSLALDKDGYGNWTVPGIEHGQPKVMRAHRVSFLFEYGYLPETVDHKCKNRNCINPEHLREATVFENSVIYSDISVAYLNSAKQCCKRGHLFDKENTYFYRNRRGCRMCRSLSREQHKVRWAS